MKLFDFSGQKCEQNLRGNSWKIPLPSALLTKFDMSSRLHKISKPVGKRKNIDETFRRNFDSNADCSDFFEEFRKNSKAFEVWHKQSTSQDRQTWWQKKEHGRWSFPIFVVGKYLTHRIQKPITKLFRFFCSLIAEAGQAQRRFLREGSWFWPISSTKMTMTHSFKYGCF